MFGLTLYNPHFKKFFIILQKGFLWVAFATLGGCSGHEKSEKDRLREQNAKGEYIYRYQQEVQYPLSPPVPREREAYPWEKP